MNEKPRPSTTSTSAAATTAASQAFLANRASNANLSSAAAAAALRSHTSSPMPVGQTQTKRMQRRGSTASNMSAFGNMTGRPGGLQRRDSGGSMTERTFRAPSPNRPERPASSHGPYPHNQDTPPVPALPKTYASKQPQRPVSSRRPVSVEPPQRISSPPPRSEGRGVSLDRGPGVMAPHRVAKTSTTLDSVVEVDRVGNRASINFSRPMSPQSLPSTALLTQSSGPNQISPAVTAAQLSSTMLAQTSKDTSNPVMMTGRMTADPPIKKVKKTRMTDVPEDDGTLSGAGQPEEGTPKEATPYLTSPIVALSTSTTAQEGTNVDQVSSPSVKRKKKKKKNVDVSKSQSDTLSEDVPAPQSPLDTECVASERIGPNERPRTFQTKAARLLAKQPSVVREDREAEEQTEIKETAKAPTNAATLNGPVCPPISNVSIPAPKNRQHSRSASQPINQQTSMKLSTLKVPGTERLSSLSPARAAHFSSEPIHETIKHQPPGRSVSPAKSALKRTPSRGHSPNVARDGITPSDGSDTTSQFSDDGQRSTTRMKRSVRVSFDENSAALGRAAGPSVGSSPATIDTQNSGVGSRSWYDLIEKDDHDSGHASRDQDDSIAPTPALPTFGSIHDREQQNLSGAVDHEHLSADWAKETLQSMDTSTGSAVDQPMGASTIGGSGRITDSSALPAPHHPMTPETTSTEGIGFNSDGANLSRVHGDLDAGHEMPSGLSPDPDGTQVVQSSAPQSVAGGASSNAVEPPVIAIEPATPGLDETIDQRQSWPGMPGSFSTGSGRQDISIRKESSSAPGQIVEESENVSQSSDGNSVYSDAAEDQSDVDGDGFGSINAIMERQTKPKMTASQASPPPAPRQNAPDGSQLDPATRKENELSEPGSTEGWDRAQAYWSGLSQTRKQQLEQAALPGAIDEPPVKNRTMRGAEAVPRQKKKKTKKIAPSTGASDAPLSPSLSLAAEPRRQNEFSSQNVSGPHLRSSMRNGKLQEPVSRNKSSEVHATTLTGSMNVQPRRTRPVSAVAMVDYNKGHSASSPVHTRAVSTINSAVSSAALKDRSKKQPAHQAPSLTRVASDSSFKKARATSPDGTRYTMKRSMRNQSSDSRVSNATSNRASSLAARTSSPTGSFARRPFSSLGPSNGGMRSSMRDSIDSKKPSRVSTTKMIDSGGTNRTKSPSRFSFGRTQKATPTEPRQSLRFSSRFDDSSDDEGTFHAKSSSRFADSSSDDEPSILTPVRGIPRRIDEGDSTDLEDSSGEDREISTKKTANGIKSPTKASPEGPAVATGSLRTASDSPKALGTMGIGFQAQKNAEKEKKKRSFFGTISRKRDGSTKARDSGSSPQTEKTVDRLERELGQTPKSQRAAEQEVGPIPSKAGQMFPGSIPDKFNINDATIARNSPKSPKLQRKVAPRRIPSTNNVSWPLPQHSNSTTSIEVHRPRTSDGAAQRQSSGQQRSTAPDASDWLTPRPTASLLVAKKKRFPLLRKAFGLPD